jgi:hypothetical protein
VVDATAERCYLGSDPALHKQLAGLAQFVKQMCDASFQHIKGHCDDPWNELADVAAKACAKGIVDSIETQNDPLLKFPCSEQAQGWLWLLQAKTSDCTGKWPNITEGKLFDRMPDENVKEHIWGKIREGLQSTPHDSEGVEVTLICATANVLTLDPSTEVKETKAGGLMLPGRTELLEQMFSKSLLVMVGIQEGRAPKSDIRLGKIHDATKRKRKRS